MTFIYTTLEIIMLNFENDIGGLATDIGSLWKRHRLTWNDIREICKRHRCALGTISVNSEHDIGEF